MTESLKPLCALFFYTSVFLCAGEGDPDALVERYCIDCHDGGVKKGGLDLDSISSLEIGAHPEIWEHVIKRLETRQMPPRDEDFKPDEAGYQAVLKNLTGQLDKLSETKPDPGDIDAIRRMTRTEYANAIRDLLGVEVDVAELLPKDESSHGFDNITVGSLSPTLLNRYISAAEKIAKVAVGAGNGSPQARIERLPADRTQEEHTEGLPFGTRGGLLLKHTFPATGEYEIEIRLTRDRDERVEGLFGNHQLEVLVDGETEAAFTVSPPANGNDHTKVDADLKQRIKVDAGTRQLGVTFVKNSSSLLETKREPYDAQFNVHRHPRQSPAVYQVSILGPFSPEKDFKTHPLLGEIPTPEDAVARAEEILIRLMGIAYRRNANEDDLNAAMDFYSEGAQESGFLGGMESALASVLVSPSFLFRVEKTPPETRGGETYRIGDFELASRLSFFLWSSIPDEELLDAANSGELSHPAGVTKQVKRMLASAKAGTLATNFANQWLHLRNLDSVSPDLRMFPDFDDNLRESMRMETELFFQDLVRGNRSVTDLLTADYTFLNERLAKHYNIPHVIGNRFRKVKLDANSKRGGLLRHGSVLTVTSYANRTSPVIRGNWILDNILGTPTPPPPADVPSLDDVVISASLPMRQRLAKHREDKGCASCHNLMDPPGFALEHYDAVGRWRAMEEAFPVDSSGGLPDGQDFSGVEGLENGLLKRPEVFASTVTEKLLTYALGRGLESYDAPAVRKILRAAEPGGYKFSDIITGICESVPFTMRKAHVSK